MVGGADTNNLSSTYLQERNMLQDSLYLITSQLDLLDSLQNEKQTKNKDTANFQNTSIAAQLYVEDYEREINNIYIKTIAQGEFEFEETFKQRIEFISGLCPLIGGTAVFKARSLLALYNPFYYYDDHELCALQGVAYKKAQIDTSTLKFEPKLNVFPSPSNGFITVELIGNLKGTFELNLISLTGQLIVKKETVTNQTVVDLKTLNISQGIYLVEFKHIGTAQTFRTRFVYGN